VVGPFSRSLDDLHYLVEHTLDVNKKTTRFPTRILYPLDFFPHSNPKHQAMVDEFISVLENFLGTKRHELSIAERWAQCPPNGLENQPLKKYLAKSAFWSLCHDYYHEFDDYRDKFRAKLGTEAYEGPVVKYRWGIGKQVTSEEYDTYMNELKIFREWFNDNIFSSDPESGSEAIMIMPYGSANPKYRDSPNEAPSSAGTIGEKFISPVLHMPQLVLPFGQMPYQSRVSGRLEHRPIGSTLVGAKGSDLMLIDLARKAFKTASWPTTIDVGRYMFPLAENTRNVAEVKTSEEQDSFLKKQLSVLADSKL